MALATPKSGLGSSYRGGGQKVRDKSFEVWNKANNAMLASVTKSIDSMTANQEKERVEDERVRLKENEYSVQLADKVGSLPEIGFHTFDQNKDDFFYGEKDKWLKIANGMRDGSISADIGGKALNELSGQLNLFKTAAPEILAAGIMLQESMKIPAGEPGAISVTAQSSMVETLLALVNNQDVSVVKPDGGPLSLFLPKSDDSDGGMINVQEFLNSQARGETIFPKVPDISGVLEGAATNIIGSKKTGWVDKYTTIESTVKDGQEITTRRQSKEQQELMKTAMIDTGQFEYEIEKNGALIYADYMKRNEPWLATEEQVKEVETFLADKAVEEHAQKEGIIMGHRKYKPSGGTGGTKLSAAQKKQMKLTGDIDEVIGEVAELDTLKDKLNYMNKKIPGEHYITGEDLKKKVEEMQREIAAKINKGEITSEEGAKEIEVEYGVYSPMEINKDDIYDTDFNLMNLEDNWGGNVDEFITDTVIHKRDKTKEAVSEAYSKAESKKAEEEFNKAWAAAKSGETVIGPNGKKYKKP